MTITAFDIKPAVLRVSEAATYLGVSADTVYRLIHAGDVPHVRVGNSIRLHRKHLDTYLRERTTTQWQPVDGRGRRT